MSRSRWPRSTMAVLLVGLLCSSLFVAPAASSAQATRMDLFVHVGGSSNLLPLDPLTLADGPGTAPAIWQDQGSGWPEIAVSGDGATAVVLHAPDDPHARAVAIHDGIDGELRRSIPLESRQFIAHLGHDGRYLALAEGLGCGPAGCGGRIWYTYDTQAGAMVATTTATDLQPAWPTMFAPDGTRLYEPVYLLPDGATATEQPGPWPLAIVAYDLLTGTEVARLPVPEIVGGSWSGEPIDGMYLGHFENPAIALSPDGATIAVIDAEMRTLITIDTATMQVGEKRDIRQPTSWLTATLRWLGLVPQDAEAKVGDGRSREARWTADGRSLLVTGYETVPGEEPGAVNGTGYGLVRIDAGSGEIRERIWDGQVVDAVSLLVDPAGDALYAVVYAQPWWEAAAGGERYLLYRLDPERLTIFAKRAFSDWPHALLLPGRE